MICPAVPLIVTVVAVSAQVGQESVAAEKLIGEETVVLCTCPLPDTESIPEPVASHKPVVEAIEVKKFVVVAFEEVELIAVKF